MFRLEKYAIKISLWPVGSRTDIGDLPLGTYVTTKTLDFASPLSKSYIHASQPTFM